MRLPLLCLICLLLAGWLPGARAGALYQCSGSQGETVFSSTTAGYRNCKQIASFGDSKKSDGKSGGKPSLAWVTGWAETTATPIPLRLPSLDQVEGGVETTAQALPVAPLPAHAGQWSYSDSHDHPLSPTLATMPGSDTPDNRVLRGAVYRVVHKDGSVEYTNIAPGGSSGSNVTKLFSYIATCAACDLHSRVNWGTVALHLDAFNAEIREASLETGVNEALIRAIIHAESAFNPRALSIKGAQGLMQLIPSTAQDMGVMDAFDPNQNILGGARYLALLLKNFNGNIALTAAAYNAGPGAVLRYNGVPPFAETQVYVQRVGELVQRYDKALHPNAPVITTPAAN